MDSTFKKKQLTKSAGYYLSACRSCSEAVADVMIPFPPVVTSAKCSLEVTH